MEGDVLRIVRLVGGIFSLVGILLLLTTGTLLYQSKKFSDAAVNAAGVVTDHV